MGYKARRKFINGPAIDPNELPETERGRPQILSFSVIKRRVLFLEKFFTHKKRRFPRVGVYGSAVFYDEKGRIVAEGKLLDINEISAGFEFGKEKFKQNQMYFLELRGFSHFRLLQVKVILRRVNNGRFRTNVGVEFREVTRAFQRRLTQFLDEKRIEIDGFNFSQVI